MPKEVLVSVSKDGSTNLDFNGFVGKECLATSAKLREALTGLGISLEDTTFTPKPELNLSGELDRESQLHSQHPSDCNRPSRVAQRSWERRRGSSPGT